MLFSPKPEREVSVPSPPSFATPRLITGPEECWFYHTMDLPEVGTVTSKGAWDLRGRFPDYTGHVDIRGMSFLDLGAASGFASFEAEKAGAAQVTSFDAANVTHLQRVPWPDRPSDDAEAARLDQMKNGYWLAHRLLNSSCRVVYGDIFRLSQEVEPADTVFIGQILIHLRDPLEALRQASLVARNYLIIAEGMMDYGTPVGLFCGGRETGTYYGWWQFSPELYQQFLDILGFDVESINRNNYHCGHPQEAGMISTIVARRRA